MTLGAFACILSHAPRAASAVEDIAELAGLAQTNLPMAFALRDAACSRWPAFRRSPASSAKCYVFLAADQCRTSTSLAVIGVLASVVGAYYYLRIVKIMFFDEPVASRSTVPAFSLRSALGLAALFMVGFVLYPAPLVKAAAAVPRNRSSEPACADDDPGDPARLRTPGHRVVPLDEVDSTNAEVLRRAAAGERGRLVDRRPSRRTAAAGRSAARLDVAAGQSVRERCCSAALPARRAAAAVAGGRRCRCSMPIADAARDDRSHRAQRPPEMAERPPVDGAKVSGILVESAPHGSAATASPLGIGLNLASHPGGLDQAGDASGRARLPGRRRTGARALLAARWRRWLDRLAPTAPVSPPSARPGSSALAPLGRAARVGFRQIRPCRASTAASPASTTAARLLLDLRDGSRSRSPTAMLPWAAPGPLAKHCHANHPNDSSDMPELVFLPLGGLGEIGMNAYLYGHRPGRRAQVADGRSRHHLSRASSIPVSTSSCPTCASSRRNARTCSASSLTHAHEDHIGAVPELWPRLKVPIYATPVHRGDAQGQAGREQAGQKLPINEIPLGGRFTLGPFDLEFIHMAHSIPESNGLAIRTRPRPHLSHRRLETRSQARARPAHRTKRPSRRSATRASMRSSAIRPTLCARAARRRRPRSPHARRHHQEAPSGASSSRRSPPTSARIRAVAEATHAAGRTLVVDRPRHASRHPGRHRDRLSAEGLSLRRPARVRLSRARRGRGAGHRQPGRAARRHGPHRRGRASRRHADARRSRDLFVAQHSRQRERHRPVQNASPEMGCRILTDSDALVHVTGHPRRDELRRMYEWCKPRAAIPMHGEPRHLEEHAALARACGVPRDRAGSQRHAGADRAGAGRDHRRRAGRPPLPRRQADRRRRRWPGARAAQAVVRRHRRRRARGLRRAAIWSPIRRSCWTVSRTKTGTASSIEDLVYDAVVGAVESIPKARRKDLPTVQEAARRAARSACDQATGKKPICKILLTVV